MKSQLITAVKFLLIMTVITGIIYPMAMTIIAGTIFPVKASGSLILKDGKVVGSGLIGQKFDSSIYFWSRPSAINYNPIPSSGSNLGPTSDILKTHSIARRSLFVTSNNISDSTRIPLEMIFASGSGLDPHISPEAALLQVDRITKARHFSDKQKEEVLSIVHKLTEAPQFGFLGEPMINVLFLNLELDKITIENKTN